MLDSELRILSAGICSVFDVRAVALREHPPYISFDSLLIVIIVNYVSRIAHKTIHQRNSSYFIQ